MKKNIVLLCSGLIATNALNASNEAHAINFSEKTYGRIAINVGYSLQSYTGDLKESINAAEENGLNVNKIAHQLTGSIGFNVYRRVTEIFHPYVGIEVSKKLHLTNELILGNSPVSYHDNVIINAKLGSAFITDENFAISVYGLIGIKTTEYKLDQDSKSTVGLNTGAGLEALFCNYFTIGAEYQFGIAKLGNIKNLATTDNMVVKTHGFAVKLGVQFM